MGPIGPVAELNWLALVADADVAEYPLETRYKTEFNGSIIFMLLWWTVRLLNRDDARQGCQGRQGEIGGKACRSGNKRPLYLSFFLSISKTTLTTLTALCNY